MGRLGSFNLSIVSIILLYSARDVLIQAVACFDGGNFILGGLVLKEQKYIDFGLALVNGCHDTYVSELTGIGPESFEWVESSTPKNDPNNPQPPADQAAF